MTKVELTRLYRLIPSKKEEEPRRKFPTQVTEQPLGVNVLDVEQDLLICPYDVELLPPP